MSITPPLEVQGRKLPIFVFGSNLAGRHGLGAALFARDFHGAQLGVGVGRTGNAYAIPTKDAHLRTLPLYAIEHHVKVFLQYAALHHRLEFKVTRIGCGLAGYKDRDIAPMFASASRNCTLSPEWNVILGR